MVTLSSSVVAAGTRAGKFVLFYDTIAAMLAATDSTTTGQTIKADRHTYTVAASDATDYHLTRGDGVKLYVQPEIERVYDFAAFNPAADGVTDDYAKIMTAIGALPMGGTLRFEVGKTYYVASTINLKKRVVLEGSSSNMFAFYGPKFQFAANTTGIIVNRGATYGFGLDDGTYGGDSGEGSILRGLWLVGSGTVRTATAGHGIWLRGRARIEQCIVEKFPGNGVQILATAVTEDPARVGNANLWVVNGLNCINNGNHGFYVEGADVNSGQAYSLDAVGNGAWGVYDSSFLGNTYFGAHSAFNGNNDRGYNINASQAGAGAFSQGGVCLYSGETYIAHFEATEAELVATTPGTDSSVWVLATEYGTADVEWVADQAEGTYFPGGAYCAAGSSNRTVFVGCYSEDGQAPGAIDQFSFAIGGLYAAGYYTGCVVNGFQRGLSTTKLTTDMETVLGGNTGLNVLEWKNEAESTPTYRLQWATNRYVIRANNLSAQTIAEFIGYNGSELMSFPNGIAIAGNVHDTASAAPTTGTWDRGDVVWNSAPSAGGKVGWVCVTAGTPGTWKAFGAIDA